MTFATTSEGDIWTQKELEEVTAIIQKDVEGIRKAEFSRPVPVKLIDKAGFVEFALKSMEEDTSKKEFLAEQDIDKMLNLVPADMDLLQATLDLLEGQVGGFYDPEGKIFYLMETFTGGLAKIILAHELTHALDDQLYDIGDGLKKRMTSRDSLYAYKSLVEGSGTAAMATWTGSNAASMDPAELQEMQSMGTDSLAAAPVSLWKPLLATYTVGQKFLLAGYRNIKNKLKKVDRVLARKVSTSDATDKAFAAPPLSMEQILHPEKYWDAEKRDDPKAVTVTIPAPAGWEVLSTTVLGELYMALLTEEPKQIDFTNVMALMKLQYTNPAAMGWGGDQLALYGKDSARWLVLTSAWDSVEDREEYTAALTVRLGVFQAQAAKLDLHKKGSGAKIEQTASGLVTFTVWHGFQPDEL
jgi:hypothetical protein